MIDYDPHKWREHFLDIRGSMIREIVWRVTGSSAWSVLIVALYLSGKIPAEWRGWLEIPSTAHALVGFALGLLLVFRTNASYDRFWEGRRQWGTIVNECRNWGRSAAVSLREAPERGQAVLELLTAFPWALIAHLRGGVPATLSPAVERALGNPQPAHLPLAIVREASREVREARRAGHLTDVEHWHGEQSARILLDCAGACERIQNTPLPFAYVVHLRRALLLYLWTLPFALVRDFGWHTIPASLGVAYVMFGIEEIGVEIENPFGADDNDLPLEQIARRIEQDLRELQRELPPAPAEVADRG